MQQITAPIRLFTYLNQQNNSIQLMSLSIHFNNSDFYLQGATGDNIYIFQESIALYVLTVNPSDSRISLNTYMAPEADAITTVSLHTLGEIEELIGLDWQLQEPLAIVQKLIKHLI